MVIKTDNKYINFDNVWTYNVKGKAVTFLDKKDNAIGVSNRENEADAEWFANEVMQVLNNVKGRKI